MAEKNTSKAQVTLYVVSCKLNWRASCTVLTTSGEL